MLICDGHDDVRTARRVVPRHRAANRNLQAVQLPARRFHSACPGGCTSCGYAVTWAYTAYQVITHTHDGDETDSDPRLVWSGSPHPLSEDVAIWQHWHPRNVIPLDKFVSLPFVAGLQDSSREQLPRMDV